MFCNELILEVGRKCNLKCDHCLRGEAQDIEMSFETAKKAVDLCADGIGSLIFTGGEPMLYGCIINEIVDYIISQKIGVSSFYVASNGIAYNPGVMNALVKLYAYCDEPEMCFLDISTDHYHQLSYAELYGTKFAFKPHFNAFSFCSIKPDIEERYVLMEGRAKDWCDGGRYPDYNDTFGLDTDDDFKSVEMLYVTAKGDLSPECDWAFDTLDSLDLPSLNDIDTDEELIDELRAYNERVSLLFSV